MSDRSCLSIYCLWTASSDGRALDICPPSVISFSRVHGAPASVFEVPAQCVPGAVCKPLTLYLIFLNVTLFFLLSINTCIRFKNWKMQGSLEKQRKPITLILRKTTTIAILVYFFSAGIFFILSWYEWVYTQYMCLFIHLMSFHKHFPKLLNFLHKHNWSGWHNISSYCRAITFYALPQLIFITSIIQMN